MLCHRSARKRSQLPSSGSLSSYTAERQAAQRQFLRNCCALSIGSDCRDQQNADRGIAAQVGEIGTS